jgi:hypothetical protein
MFSDMPMGEKITFKKSIIFFPSQTWSMNFDQTAFGAAILLNKMQDIFNL